MLIPLLVLLGVLSVPLSGGRYARLAELRVRGVWLVLLAVAAQVLVLETAVLPLTAAAAVHVATYGCVGVVLWLNRRVRGLWLLASGAALNGVTIAVNGGTLPASPGALAAAGVEPDGVFVNSGELDGARLWWLGDVFAVPAGVPLANVFSVGDVLVVVGAVWVAHAAARPAATVPTGVDAPV